MGESGRAIFENFEKNGEGARYAKIYEEIAPLLKVATAAQFREWMVATLCAHKALIDITVEKIERQTEERKHAILRVMEELTAELKAKRESWDGWDEDLGISGLTGPSPNV